jgi:hypothetical protein
VQNHSGRWVRVSRQNPCPICGKPDNCEVSTDGTVVWCGRVSEGSLRENAGGQFLHRLNAAADHGAQTYCVNHPRRPSRVRRDWTAALRFYGQESELAVLALASLLGVSPEALRSLGVGWHPELRFWTIPERDGDGRVIGISTRFEDGSKKRLRGGRAGLTYADSWDTGSGPILLVEGGSDVAALMSIGFSVVGRPSNCGGTDLLVDLLFDVPVKREIVVVGERDEKPDGAWPGRTGAISTATKLAEGLERPIGWGLPPDSTKDSRAWLLAMPEMPADRLADLFVSGIEITRVNAPVTLHAEPEPTDILSLAEWRNRLLQARLESLGRPGVYLDRSPTGAGKSRVDFDAVQGLLKGGAA